MWEKLKSFLANDTYFIVILIILMGIGSFGLGRLSVIENSIQTATSAGLQQLPSIQVDKQGSSTTGRSVVASKSGTKYHLLDCPGAMQMKEENRIEFNSKEAAEAAGYAPASNCPGI